MKLNPKVRDLLAQLLAECSTFDFNQVMDRVKSLKQNREVMEDIKEQSKLHRRVHI
jgi:hypothetical protein